MATHDVDNPTCCTQCGAAIGLADRVFMRLGKFYCSARCQDAVDRIPHWFTPAIVRIALRAVVCEALSSGRDLDVAGFIATALERIAEYDEDLFGNPVSISPAMLAFARTVMTQFDLPGHYAYKLALRQRRSIPREGAGHAAP